MSATGTAREESQLMEFNVTKSALLNELTTSQGVVERKTTIPILSNLLVEAREGRVTITATDLELMASKIYIRPSDKLRFANSNAAVGEKPHEICTVFRLPRTSSANFLNEFQELIT